VPIKAQKKTRIRRDPEAAKTLILTSAEKVLAAKGPDAVGLKEVAAEAGVSHALITHYFGTYEALVHAVLKRRLELAGAEAQRIVAVAPPGPDTLLAFFFALLSDPLHVRLTTWAVLSARKVHLIGLPAGLLEPLLQMISARREAEHGQKAASPEAVALDVTLALAAGYGFALGREQIAKAMGREPFTFEQFSQRLASLLRLTPASARE
jgi:TetR/AcrR family transcriptional regulator, repressor for neighboring sulfatase